MQIPSKAYIQKQLADSPLIFSRGESLFEGGSFFLSKGSLSEKQFVYQVDGAYGDYTTKIQFGDEQIRSSCTCPYPGDGCKHVVAAALHARQILMKKGATETAFSSDDPQEENDFLTSEDIKALAIEDREKRARVETFELVPGDLFKGDHLVINKNKRKYQVTLHDPETGTGHCSCPDYMTNGLGTCKHIHFAVNQLKLEADYNKRLQMETFPFIDIFWDSVLEAPRMYGDKSVDIPEDTAAILDKYFDGAGMFRHDDFTRIIDLMDLLDGNKRVRIRESLLNRIESKLQWDQIQEFSSQDIPEIPLKATLYPYQQKGVSFGLFKPGVLIGDEMGLGKTLQAIALGVLKKEIFGFSKILVITLASLKEQWKREIEKFSHEQAVILEGGPDQRKNIYFNDSSLFKITNYEAVLRDTLVLRRFNPDVIVLDEAQRIKNFSTKTSDAVKQIPKKHAIVLTGTPLENKLEDVYSIVQFLDPYMLTPLWQFAGDHFQIPKKKKSSVAGYKNLDSLNQKLKSIVIRRKKEDVLKDLPKEVVNNFYIDLHDEQAAIHSGYARQLLPLLNKKFLTPVDMRRIQILLLRMRMVCDATFLIDRDTRISPKLKELEGIIDEMVIQNKRKMVIFSEWTSMTFLIANTLSDMGVSFVELSGKVPVKKRQALIDEFTNNPECGVFLSTDAGGTGLNLQAADCVVNFELPWNPAKMNQRIGRVSRIGQESSCINVINLIAKRSIEEKILAGIQLKADLFKGVFDEEGPDEVDFSREKKNEMLNRLRQMMGEEPEPESFETAEPEEIPEDTPHYLNPEVLGKDEPASDRLEPEDTDNSARAPGLATPELSDPDLDQSQHIFAAQAPEKVEAVLNSGLSFIAGLMEMATGQKMENLDSQEKMITLDKETGEVTMKFKLPGF